MYEAIEALEALQELGTMGKAAARLRITQSAVSKRITALEEGLGTELIEKAGRRVRLTSQGKDFLEKARPLVRELNLLIRSFGELSSQTSSHGRLILGVAESILCSWGASALKSVIRKMPGLELELHAHRSPLVVEYVRSGDYMIGLCTDPLNEQNLISEVLAEEPLVIIPSGLKPLPVKKGEELPVISVDMNSATWSVLQRKIETSSNSLPYRIVWKTQVESFASVAQMARAGLGHGLVPIGIAKALGVPSARMIPLSRRIHRPISLIGRPTVLSRPLLQEFKLNLKAALPDFDAN